MVVVRLGDAEMHSAVEGGELAAADVGEDELTGCGRRDAPLWDVVGCPSWTGSAIVAA